MENARRLGNVVSALATGVPSLPDCLMLTGGRYSSACLFVSDCRCAFKIARVVLVNLADTRTDASTICSGPFSASSISARATSAASGEKQCFHTSGIPQHGAASQGLRCQLRCRWSERHERALAAFAGFRLATGSFVAHALQRSFRAGSAMDDAACADDGSGHTAGGRTRSASPAGTATRYPTIPDRFSWRRTCDKACSPARVPATAAFPAGASVSLACDGSRRACFRLVRGVGRWYANSVILEA